MKYKMSFQGLFLAAVVVLAGCRPALPETSAGDIHSKPGAELPLESAEAPVNVSMSLVDDTGTTIELEEYPQAIVSISPSITEILFAIGAGDQVVGRDEFSLYPEQALQVTSVTVAL